jgi:hypothetical protein
MPTQSEEVSLPGLLIETTESEEVTISYENFAIRNSANSLVTPLPKTPNDLAGSDV